MSTPLELITKALQTDAAWDIIDRLVCGRLSDTRDMFVEERQHLEDIEAHRELTDPQKIDIVTLIQDIAALERVMEIYGARYV